jgi:DNA-binding XRE family transcriptional regulator
MAQCRGFVAPPARQPVFTQEALAARLGVERSTVYRWETGETTLLPMRRSRATQRAPLIDIFWLAHQRSQYERAHTPHTGHVKP